MSPLTRLIIAGCAVLTILGLVESHHQSGAAAGVRPELKLIAEVRDKIHRYYVEPVDSLRIIEGAVDGMAEAVAQGEEGVQDSSALAEADSLLRIHAPLSNRRQLELLARTLDQLSQTRESPYPPDSLARAAVSGMLIALDPHSSYLDPQESEEMMERFQAHFEGIGIYFDIHQGQLVVISPIEGSPSYGRLRAGDHIAAIDGVSTEGITADQVMQKLRGPRGTQVQVSVVRPGAEERLEITLTRDRIPVHSVPYACLLRDRTGYIRITRFAEQTGEELGQALSRLESQGMERLILDLRGNGGGFLSQAVEVADFFLDQGQLIVYTEGREAGSRIDYHDQNPLEGEPLSLVVMIDHGSASASEIVAGAIQDLDLGLIAGQTSFGKGLVQEQFPLSSNGGLLLLTVARYFTPLGRLIQRPYTDDLAAYVEAGLDTVDANAVDSLRADAPVFHTAQGRAVYGGGGITPDVVLKPASLSGFAEEVLANGAVFDFGSRWVGRHRDWPARFEDFLANYRVSDQALDAFIAFLRQEKKLQVEDSTFAAHRPFVEGELKAEFARGLWGDEQRYRVLLEGDEEVAQALGLFAQADALRLAHTSP
jgi:carboxyl-terminal processing protease